MISFMAAYSSLYYGGRSEEMMGKMMCEVTAELIMSKYCTDSSVPHYVQTLCRPELKRSSDLCFTHV